MPAFGVPQRAGVLPAEPQVSQQVIVWGGGRYSGGSRAWFLIVWQGLEPVRWR